MDMYGMPIQNTEEWRNFFDQYKALPELWDTECKMCERKVCRSWAWLILLNRYKSIDRNATLDTVKHIISNIRSCYIRERRKVRQSMKSGNVYTPTLWYYKNLNFLPDNEIGSLETTNIEAFESSNIDEEILKTSNNVTVGNRDSAKPVNSFQQKSINSVYTQSENQHKSELIKQKHERDEALIFAEGWACLFRKLTTKQRLYAKKLIDETLFFGLHNKLSMDSAISINNNNLQHQNHITDEKDYNESEYGDNEDINSNPVEEINVQTPYTDESVFNETEEIEDILEVNVNDNEREKAQEQLNGSKEIANGLHYKECNETMYVNATDNMNNSENEECNYLIEEIKDTLEINVNDSEREETQEQFEGNKKKNSLECRFCHLILGRPYARKDHERLHTGEKPYQCKSCGKHFRTAALRRLHYKKCNQTMHVNTADNMNNSENTLTDCDSKTVIDAHENHSEDKTISNDTDIESITKELELQYEELNSRNCKFCGKTFYRLFQRREHEAIHTGENPYSCKFCKALFSTRTKHKKHVKLCSLNPDPKAQLKRHKCDVCSAEFRDRTNFIVHTLRHKGIKKYQCSFCEKRFVSSSEKQIHERFHTNERPYLCTMCGKNFTTNSSYHSHIRRHTGERLHKCGTCDKAYFAPKQLREHEITHSTERPFVCNVCTSAFSSNKRLRAHMKVHDEVGQFVCKICGKVFKQSAGLCGHIKSSHRVIKETLEKVSG